MGQKVFVTGATGFTGGALARRLLERGDRVTALVRSRDASMELAGLGAELVEGDLRDKSSFAAALAGQDVVYHIAAVFREAKIPDEQYTAINVGGTRNMVEAAAAGGVGRFVHCSTVGVHGNTGRTPADEESRYHLPDFYCKSKLEGEQVARQLFSELGVPGVVFRPAGIYGPGDLRFLKLFRGIQRKIMIGSGETYYHFTYIDDLVDGILLCGEKPEALGDVFILGGERFITLNQLMAYVAKANGEKPPAIHLPVWPIMAAAHLCEKLCKPLGIEPPLYPRRVEFFTKDRAFKIDKAKRVLGFAPKIDEEEGWRRTGAWYREQGYLS